MIVFQGGVDYIVSVDDTKNFVYNCKSSDKEFVFYKEMRHEIPHEPEIDEILDKCVQWVDKRIENLNEQQG